MLTKQQLLDEARKQKNALAVISVWRKWLFVLTTVSAVLGVFGIRSGGGWFFAGVVAAVTAVISFLLLLAVNLSIRNGHRNVENILESVQSSSS